jgi:hypothetical protein
VIHGGHTWGKVAYSSDPPLACLDDVASLRGHLSFLPGETMQLNDPLARQIVSRAMKILSFSVNLMDEYAVSASPAATSAFYPESPCS